MMFNIKRIVKSTMESMHATMSRFYEAAKILAEVTGQSNLARRLNESPQVIKNWESRGVSKRGALVAQEKLGISATWVMTGDGEMAYRPGDYSKSATVIELKTRDVDPISYPPMVEEIINFALSMSERGQAQLAERAEVLALRFPASKGNTAKSSH